MRRCRPAALVAICGALVGGCGASVPGSDPPPRVMRVAVAGDGLVPEVATGVAVGDGRVLTVAHPLAAGHAVTAGGRPARVIRVDRRLDLALLSVPGMRAPGVRLGGDGAGVAIAVIRDGRTVSLPSRLRRHVLVHFRDRPEDPPRDRPGLELGARIDPGDSGAPVLDRRGRLLGVLYARSSDAGGTAWAVDASAARTLLAG